MKKLIIIKLFLLTISYCSFAQSIVIGTGASIVVPSGADICAGTYGNITGNISGDGTQCETSPVPVELTSFTAKVSENKVMLEWETATEVNNYGFEIHREVYPAEGGTEDDEWDLLGFVEGHGNSNSPKQYSFTDNNLIGGNKFVYRLKQVDNDGQYEYSYEIEVEIVPTEFALYQNYPNPFNPSTTVKYQIPELSFVTLKVYDVVGSEIVTLVNEEKLIGNYEVEFDADRLSSGIYFYRLQAGSFVETKKMILLK